MDFAAMMEDVARLVGFEKYDLRRRVSRELAESAGSGVTVMRESRSWFSAVVYDT